MTDPYDVSGIILINDQDLNHLKRLPLSERQRLLGICTELCLFSYSSYCDPVLRTASPTGWVRVAHLGDQPSLQEGSSRWWWKFNKFGISMCYAPDQPTDEPAQNLTAFNPLSLLIRSPEQASIRRLMLTEAPKVTLIDAPWGCGLSWGLALAIVDRLQEVDGDIMLLSAQAQTMKSLIHALSPDLTDRLYIMSFEEAYEQSFKCKPWHQSLSLVELSERLQEINAQIPEHHWMEFLPLFKLLAYQPQVNKEILQELEPLWGESAFELFKRLKLEPYTEQTQLQDWPWHHLSCVVIDDALMIPKLPLCSFLTLTHQALSDRNRGWRLILAGREQGFPNGLSTQWQSIEQYCLETFGKPPLKQQLTQSERLTKSRISLISAIGECDPRPWIERARRQNHFEASHKPLHFDALASVGILAIDQPLSPQDLQLILESVQGAPNSLLIDLSQQQVYTSKTFDVPNLNRVLTYEAIWTQGKATCIEPNPLVVYAPNGLICHAQWARKLPKSLKKIVQSLEVQQLRYLLSRTGGSIYLIGSFSESVLQVMKSHPVQFYQNLSQLSQSIDTQSAWGGSWSFQAREQARTLIHSRRWADALTKWREILPIAENIFGSEGYQEAIRSLQVLYNEALAESIKAKAWRQTAALYQSIPDYLKMDLDQDQALSLKVNVQELISIAHEAMKHCDDHRLEQILHQLDGLGELKHAQALFQQLTQQVWHWSLSNLKEFNQSLQRVFMKFLYEQNQYLIEYQCLHEGYSLNQPQAGVLCPLAETILAQPESLRKRWASRHLICWANELHPLAKKIIPPSFKLDIDHEQGQEESRLYAQLILIFSLISAQANLGILSKRMIQNAFKQPDLNPYLRHFQEAFDHAKIDPTILELTQALYIAWNKQSLFDQRINMRILGDLKGLEESYSKESPPPHLKATFELRGALERSRGLWHSLTAQEQAELTRAWDFVRSATPNPRWGIDSLSLPHQVRDEELKD